MSPPELTAIRAELAGSDSCAAAGLTVTGNAPALVLCRELIAAGLDPDRALDVYRNGVLALRIRSIGEAAALDVRDDNRGTPRFVRYRPGPAERARSACGGAPPVRQTETPASRVREAPESAATAFELEDAS